MSIRIHTLFASLLILAGACNDTGTESATDSTTSDGSSGSAAEQTSTTTGTTTGDATSDAPTTDAPSSTDSPTAYEPTTDSPTGDEPTTGEPAEPPAECAAHCDKQVSCGFFESVPECLDWCADDYTRSFPACQDATATYLTCMAGLSCDELSPFGDEPPCPAERAPMYDLCNDEYEFCGVSVGAGGDECDLAIDCDGQPRLELLCTDTTCTCLSAGVMVGSCEPEGICADWESLLEKSEACCGF